MNEFFAENYGDLLEELAQLTGWAELGEVLTPVEMVFAATDNLHSQRTHGFPTLPALEAHYDLLTELQELIFLRQYGLDSPDDPRGPLCSELARTYISDIEAAVAGSSPVKLNIYSTHGWTLLGLEEAMGIEPKRWELGAGWLLELHRDVGSGQYFLEAFDVFVSGDGETYDAEQVPLMCPSASLRCPLEAFVDFVGARNPERAMGQADSCCYICSDASCRDDLTGFAGLGCTAYLDPATAEIFECSLYRKFCPEVSCAALRQVVDHATGLCVEVVG